MIAIPTNIVTTCMMLWYIQNMTAAQLRDSSTECSSAAARARGCDAALVTGKIRIILGGSGGT